MAYLSLAEIILLAVVTEGDFWLHQRTYRTYAYIRTYRCTSDLGNAQFLIAFGNET